MKKLCIVATIPAAVHSFLRQQINHSSRSFAITVICNDVDMEFLRGIDAQVVILPIKRKPSLLNDLVTLAQLYRIFRREKFDVVHTHMPKTNLLGMFAATLARVPVRICTFHGDVWVTRQGWKRAVLKALDQFTAMLAHRVFLVSPSQRNFLIKNNVLSEINSQVIGSGSICGVDTQRFKPDAAMRKKLRAELGISETQTVLLFVGRMNHEKGIPELVRVFAELAAAGRDVVLMLVGAEENIRYVQVREMCGQYQQRLRTAGFTANPEKYMAAADIFCLPSQREGFGQVIIEAAACGVPTVATDIYGIRDAVVDGETGLLFAPGNAAMFKQQLLRLIEEPQLRARLALAARERAIAQFESRKIIDAMHDFYAEVLAGDKRD